ncbi:MAG: hypothetical protein AAGG68_10705 [Bacteroidota bacterium]
MIEPKRFPYVAKQSDIGEAGFFPLLPIQLIHNNQTIDVHGLLDSGSTVNVLPFEMGISLGLDWNSQNIPITLTGNLAKVESRAVLINAKADSFPQCHLAFAWTKSNDVPLLLGQTNFFMEFNVFFYRSQLAFEVVPK